MSTWRPDEKLLPKRLLISITDFVETLLAGESDAPGVISDLAAEFIGIYRSLDRWPTVTHAVIES